MESANYRTRSRLHQAQQDLAHAAKKLSRVDEVKNPAKYKYLLGLVQQYRANVEEAKKHE
jgi:hypothetical protein